jgi:hypothetical protein
MSWLSWDVGYNAHLWLEDDVLFQCKPSDD